MQSLLSDTLMEYMYEICYTTRFYIKGPMARTAPKELQIID